MISRNDLTSLINHRLRDSSSLISERRYRAGIYLGGYAVELVLKRRICISFGLTRGFPETPAEFNSCAANFTGSGIRRLRQIKTHNLNNLLFFSGFQSRISSNYNKEWNIIISQWLSEMRYKTNVIRANTAIEFLNSVKQIVNVIR